MPVKEPQRVYPARVILTAGGADAPFIGMRDARETTAQTPSHVLLAQNMYIRPGGGGRAYIGRPGITTLGAAFANAVQAVTTWYRPSGVPLTLAVSGGEIYTYNWAGTWTKVVTTANLTSASVTFATTGRVALCPFATGIVLSDGVNKAWSWDGTTGAGGITKLTNAPVFYGRPWVKSAKLVGINAANRLEIQWSEEAQVNTGYAVGGYNNAWQLGQLGNAPLVAGIGRNEGMLMFRERACFTITGEIGTDFATVSTRSDLSDSIGTTAPWSLYNIDSGVAFVDSDGRPQVAVPGSGIQPLWPDCLETVQPARVPASTVFRAVTLEDRACKLLVIGMPSATSAQLMTWLYYDSNTMQFVGIGTNMPADLAGMVLNATGQAQWVHVDGVNVYLHGDPTLGPWSDTFRAGTQAIAHALELSCLGYDLTEELTVDTIEVGLSATQASTLTITGETPNGLLPSLVVPIVGGQGVRLGVFRMSVDILGGVTRDRRVEVGTVGNGRWVRPIVRHAVLGEPLEITGVRVVAYKDGADPDVN